MTRGSTWNIWEFHLHSPCSVLNNKFGSPDSDEVWERYISQIEVKAKEKGIVAVGVTDYFTIEGYKRVVEFQKRGRLPGILVFPNIEFRADKLIYRSRGDAEPKRLNLHVIFSPDVRPVEIEEGFLHELDFVHESDPFEPATTRKLKISNLNEFGERLQNQHPKFKEQSPFAVGCMNAIIHAEQLKERLDNRFRGRHLLVLADEDLSLLDWDSQHHATRKQLVQMSHAILSSNERTRQFCLGKTHDSATAYLDEFKSLKPCIWGCDSHGFEERFMEPDLRRYCWIKAEVSWEGLKQILYEPEERVCIQEVNPEPDKSIYTLAAIEVSKTNVNAGLAVNGFNVELNPNLVTIIGGRGSGKTALLDLIASCFREGNKLEGMELSFYHRLYAKEDYFERVGNQPIDLSLAFKSGERFTKSVGRDTFCFDKADVIYLTQNHFDEFSADPDKLNKRIIDLVFEKFSDEKREYEKTESEIDDLERTIQTINLEIEQLKSDIVGQKEQEEEDLKIQNGAKSDYLQRIQDIESKQESHVDEAKRLTESLNSLKLQKWGIENLLEKLSALRDDINSLGERYSASADQINNDLTLALDGEPVTFLPSELPELSAVVEIIDINRASLDRKIPLTEDAIDELAQQISELEGINKVIAELHQKVNSIAADIVDIESRLREIAEKEERIKTLDNQRVTAYADLMKKVVGLRVYLQSMIDQFEAGKDRMLSNLKFAAVVDMKKNREYIEVLAEKTDNRVHSVAELVELFAEIFKDMDRQMNNDASDANLSNIAQQIRDLAASLKLKKSVSYSDFYNVVLRRFFGIGLKIEFNGKSLVELSMGERAIILLKVLLALDDKPLLIDQPEEHLDNRYIYDELTPAFRKAKTKRQIIIATHNANLVVNTDAEQIIIAEHVNGMLSYKVGTLEDMSIRSGITTILEGGDEAFKKREEKYGYKF